MRKIRIRTKLVLFTLASVLTALLFSSVVGYISGKRALETASMDKLTAVREMKASQLEDYFLQIRSQVSSLAESRMIVDAMNGFRRAFHETDGRPEEFGTDTDIDRRLQGYYKNEFLPLLNRNLDRPFHLEAAWPEDSRTRKLQDLYISANPNPTGEKHRLDDAGDGSAYSGVHRAYHPILRRFLERFGYYDIFLIDPETGHIVYSVFKEVDFATSLTDGPYAASGLATAITSAGGASDPDFARLVDYAPYIPSYNAHASFIASPIFDDGHLVGILAFQMPVDRINAIMTNHQAWPSVGLGESGETYIVGEDYTLRNQSRFLIEDREGYLRMITDIGVPKSTVERITNLEISIGLQEVRTSGTAAAFRGETGEQIINDYRGVKVLSSYRPLKIKDVNWIIMSEIDEAEAFAGVRQFGFALLGTGLVLVLAFSVIGVLVAWSLTRPLGRLTNHARELGMGRLDSPVDVNGMDEIGQLGNSFESMRTSIKSLVDELEESNRTLEDRVAERTTELERASTRIQLILKNASDAIITIDSEQNIVMFNPMAEQMFGYAADDVMNRPLSMILPRDMSEQHPEHVRSFMDSPEVSRAMGSRAELRGRRQDGSEFPVTVGISKMIMGDEMLMTAFVRDISELKQHEEQILKQNLLLENTIESLTHPFYVVDATDFKIKIANSAAKKWWAGNDEPTCYAITHRRDAPCDSDDDPCPLEAVKRTKQPVMMEHVHYDEDGNKIYVEVHGYPIFDERGNVIQMIEYSLDITKRKEMEAQLAEAFETIKTQKERMEGELNVAREIQMSMLPLIFPAFPERKEFEIFATLQPAREVGGDFYDFFFIDERRFCFGIGDVSDKGVPSALFMAVAKTLIKSRAMDDHSTASILTHVNDELSRENDSGMFVTVFLGILDLETRIFTFTNAGHNPPYLRRVDGSLDRLDSLHGPVIGALNGMTYGEDTRLVSPGDHLFLYTDGITEAMNANSDLFTEKNLVAALDHQHEDSAESLVNRILAAVQEHVGEADPSDDLTVLALQFHEPLQDSLVDTPLSIRLQNDLTEIPRVIDDVVAYVDRLGLEPSVKRKLGIVLDELLNNIISYAYPDEEAHEIAVQASVFSQRLVISISDDGIPFNAFSMEQPDVGLSLEEREVGGLGIHLVRSLMDEVNYQRAIGRNVVTLVKQLDREETN